MRADKLLTLLICLTAGVAQGQQSDSCSEAKNTLELNECLSARLKRADDKLNAVYQRVMQAFSKPDMYGFIHYSEARKELVKAQRAWIAYRDGDCKAVYALAVGGSERGQLALQCRQGRTEQRIKELEQFLEP